MPVTQLLMFAPMLGLLVVAAVIDYRRGRIPNWLTCSLALGGLAQSFTPLHTVSPWHSMLGLLIGFTLTFILFAMGGLGGGDVKLMAAVGAWLGPIPTLVAYTAEAIMGMAIVIVYAALQGRLTRLVRNSAVMAFTLASVNDAQSLQTAAVTGKACADIGGVSGKRLPWAVPLLMAVLVILAYATSR